ncbi:hypothetical protein POM88_024693 [Heracleum sosnowskyi]|uniref:F-box domain-containing protein n=1 Tax=Heracleum sosnowskyi TaxID=360622 RepID=A0AAD8I2I6_9APIA|nr:hypothetical protein POM88_024693 [Heracleum sosnowskyi]
MNYDTSKDSSAKSNSFSLFVAYIRFIICSSLDSLKIKYQEKMMRKRSSVFTTNVSLLPEEILCLILSWLEEKYLLRCKSVCKVWHDVIVKNKQFIDIHAIHNGRRFHNSCKLRRPLMMIYLGDDAILNDTELKLKKKFRRLSHSCTGLLVEGLTKKAFTTTTDIYRIRNPTTKRILDLPRPREKVFSMSVFLHSSTSSFYVISLNRDEELIVKLEVIDLGGQSNDPCPEIDLSWRNLNIPGFDKAINDGPEKYYRTSFISEDGILFMFPIGSSNPATILCVDLVQEVCTIVNAPEGISCGLSGVRIQLWRGKLTIASVSEEKLNVWVLEDYKKHKWSDKVIPLPFLNQNPHMKNLIPELHQGDEEDFLVYLDDYNVGGQDYRHVYKLDSKVLSHGPTPPISMPATFVSVKGMRAIPEVER